MAVTKLWKVSVRLGQVLDYTTNPEKTANPQYSSEDYQALKDVLAYAKDEEKTEHEFFCDGINCNVAMARDQFITVKEQFGKTDGIQAYHGYLSFKENEVTPEQAQQIGMEFATKMWGKRFQVVVTTHLNTKHLHCHFVINSVSFADGKRLKDKEKSWYYFRHIADEICLEHKLSIVEKPELHRSPAYLTKKDEAGMPTRYNNAKKAIDEAIAMSRNLRQFQYELSVMGYHSNFSPNRKYATVTPKGSEKPIRTYRLGEEYTKEKILERLIANRDNIVFKPFQPKTYIVRQYRLPTRENKGDGCVAVLHPQLQIGQPRRFLFRPQCHRKSPVRLNDRVGHIPRIKDVLAAQGFHQVGHRQAQGAQSVLVDLSVQDHGFGPPGQQIEKLLAAEAQRRAQQFQRSNEKQWDQAGRHRNILRFNGDGRQIGDQDGGH